MIRRAPGGGGGYIFLTKFKGYLDGLRENVEVLDEAIANARAMSKARKGSDNRVALQWAKTLRDLVELRNTTLSNIKVHLLGRDETGSAIEPADYYDGKSEVMFERDFQTFLAPWTREDLKLKCEDCGTLSDEVSTRAGRYQDEKDRELCDKCYEKRTAKEPESP